MTGIPPQIVNPKALAKPLFVLGPAYSGKSQWAKKTIDPSLPALLIRSAPEIIPPYPLGQSGETELPAQWKSIPSGLDLTAALFEALDQEIPVLVDSLNQWIGRLISEEGPRGKSAISGRIQEFIQKLLALGVRQKSLLTIVSSEAGASPPPAVDQERFFRQCLGVTNQHLASLSQTVILVQAGLPVILKAPF
jgi:adenosyl cobinamide kinase/adenosyl cobinamide phosphate guanylyltransferase